MPEYIRALIFILVMAALVFKFSEVPATTVAMTKDSFVSRRNTWIGITLAGFLSQNIWVFYLISAILVHRVVKKDSNKIALFFFLILAMPELSIAIPGFAGINYIILITYQRMLVWVILLPMFWAMMFDKKSANFVWNFSDVLLVLYFSLNVILQFQYQNFTDWVRILLGWIFDVLIPYFVVSRSIKDVKSFREIAMAFIVGAMIVSLIGIFELVKHWLLYQTLGDAIGVDGGFGYIGRGGNVRAIATTGQAIVLGYVLAIAVLLYWFLERSIANRKQYWLGFLLLLGGIISPLSKGPWVGAAVAIVIVIVLGPKAISRLSKMALMCVAAFIAILFTEYADQIISYLPFVGTLDESSMDYRKLLFEKSMDVIYANPYFGSFDYMLYLEDLRQGQGIIDLVNNYISVALNSGFVGLGLYALFFISIFWRVFFCMKKTPFISEEHEMGQVIIGVLASVLLMISAASDILNVPIMYWTVSAMGVAYSLMRMPVEGHSHKYNM